MTISGSPVTGTAFMGNDDYTDVNDVSDAKDVAVSVTHTVIN